MIKKMPHIYKRYLYPDMMNKYKFLGGILGSSGLVLLALNDVKPLNFEHESWKYTQDIPYIQLFQEAAREKDIDLDLLLAVAYHESKFNPEAKSPTGVRGLMQITRETAKKYDVDNRLDPEQSIHGGSAYLAECLKITPSLDLVLACYNGGHNKIGKVPRLHCIKEDLRNETKLYVERVGEFYKRLEHSHRVDYDAFKEIYSDVYESQTL
jgi:soluble lytic murein transglycosylase-like protein